MQRNGFLWIGLLLALSGCATTGRSTPSGAYTDVVDVGRELGMTVQRDAGSQGLVLSDGANRVVVCPGMSVAMVNGQFVDMPRPARMAQGRLVMPVEAVRKITPHLRARPAGGARR